METPTIRAVHPDDAPALCAMANLPGFRFGTGRLPYSRLATTEAWIAGLSQNHTALVAVLENAVVGAAGFERHDGRRAHAALLHIGVHDDWAGRGVGTALMAALIDSADRWLGLRRLELTVYADNAPAIALYRRHGFETEGTLRGFALRDGQFVDALTMARWVPPPGEPPP